MSTPTTFEALLKALPSDSLTSAKSVLTTDTNGKLGKAPASSVPHILSADRPASSLAPGWIRIVKLGSTTSSTPMVHVIADITVMSVWSSTAPKVISFRLHLATATWDWSQGRVLEERATNMLLESSAKIYSKFRIVVEFSGSVGSVYLETYTAKSATDYGKPYVYVTPLLGSPVPMTPEAGSVPNGAISSEFEIATFGGGVNHFASTSYILTVQAGKGGRHERTGYYELQPYQVISPGCDDEKNMVHGFRCLPYSRNPLHKGGCKESSERSLPLRYSVCRLRRLLVQPDVQAKP